MNWKDLEVSVNFPAEIVCEEAGTGETCITLTWTKGEYKAPALNVTWAVPLVDIQYEWYPCAGGIVRCVPIGMHRSIPASLRVRRCSASTTRKGRIA